MSTRISDLYSAKSGFLRQWKRDDAPADGPTHARRRDDLSSPVATVEHADLDHNFQLLFSANPHPMFVVDRHSLQFMEVNAAAVRAYGFTRDELVDRKLTDLLFEEEIPRALELAEKLPPSLCCQGFWRHRRKSGEIFDAEVTTQGIRFAGRDAVLTSALDVSARRAAEEKVAEQSASLRALTENNPLAVVVLDADRRIQMCNPAFELMFGYHQAEILGADLDPMLAPGELAAEAAQLTERASTGEVVRVRAKRRRSDGSMVEVQIVGVPLIVNGKRTGTFGMYEDISDRARAEHAQHEAETRLQNLFENAVEGIFQSTPEGKLLSANPALARMCGYESPEQMVAEVKHLAQDTYADANARLEFERRMRETGSVRTYEYQLRRKDGTKLWVSESARCMRDERGEIACYEGTIEDITERKRSELERQVNFEIIHAVNATDNLSDLLLRIHQSLKRLLYAENCFVALFEPSTAMFHFPFFADQFDQAPPPQQVGRSCTAYVYRTGRAMVISQKVFDQLAADGEVELVGTPSPTWLGVPLRTPAATIGVLVVQHYENENAYDQRDLEFLASVGGQIALAIERKRADAKVRESEARMRVLVEQLPAVLWTVDKSFRFTSCLGSGLAALGLRPNQLVGSTLLEYFDTTDVTFMPIASHRRALAGEPTTFHLEWKSSSFTCHVEALRNADGDVEGAICMALDITDRKQLEEQLRQAQKMEAVGRLAGGIAHDFNNLLMVIQGYADLLAERLPERDPLRRNAEQIQTASQRATSLTRQLLAFSRKQMLAPKVLNVQSVVADMEKILRRLIGEDVLLESSSAPDLGLVKADRSQIEQVILNLCVNARDAMPEGGRLTIETANVELDATVSHPPAMLSPGRYVMLAVTDNGMGMDAQTQAHIFEPFFTTKEKGKGTGLGLATVYGIVKQSGGYVWVYSEPGQGTSFKVYLPRIEEGVSSAGRDGKIVAKPMPRGSETILLVEDEKGVRELAREYLHTCGYNVVEAEDGHTALEIAGMHKGQIDLLMTDVVMPGISGRELAQRVKAQRPGIKVLYMSGYTDQSVVKHGILENDAVLLQKPFTMATLALKLRELFSDVEAQPQMR